MKSERKFLVTGPTGATGGETVEQLLEKGHAVRALAHREDERSERLSKLGAEVVFSGMNNYVQEIGGRPPMTVEQFVEKHRSEFWE